MAPPHRKPLQLLNNRVAAEPPVETSQPSEIVDLPRANRQANREGKRAVTVYVSQEVWAELRVLSARSSAPGARITTQELMEEAISLLFQAHNVPHPTS
jgi:hypothetical protein